MNSSAPVTTPTSTGTSPRPTTEIPGHITSQLSPDDHSTLRSLARALESPSKGSIDSILSTQSQDTIIKSAFEIFMGEQLLKKSPPGYFICGAARLQREDIRTGQMTADWALTSNLGGLVSQNGAANYNGGGPGGMAASSEGTYMAGGHTVGVCIKLPHEELPNPHLTEKIVMDGFFPRKLMLVRKSAGALIGPGGMGTQDEAFECVRFAIEHAPFREIFPVAFVGDMYKPLEDWFTKDPHGPVGRGYLKELPPFIRFFSSSQEADAVRFVMSLGKDRFERLKRERSSQAETAEALYGDEVLYERVLQGMSDELDGDQLSFRASERAAGAIADRTLMDLKMVARIAHDLSDTFKCLSKVDHGNTILTFGGAVRVDDQSILSRSDVSEDLSKLGEALAKAGQSLLIGAPVGLPADVAQGALCAGGRVAMVPTRFDLDSGSSSWIPAVDIGAQVSQVANYAFTQRIASLACSRGAIALPGAIRTIDLLAEIWNLRMCHKCDPNYNIALVDKKFWGGYLDFLREASVQEGGYRQKASGETATGYIDEREINLPLLTDDPSEAVDWVTHKKS
jgi:predicted Rossmann-fold nucleotide-binding protein